MSQPKVSVIMGIYNCEHTLSEAIDSILNQTYTNWDLIMCDDGSTDETYSVAKEYQKKYPDKISLLKNDQNMKLSYTLNRCLEVATGELIARMDGDDISHADRFEKQVKCLQEHPGFNLVGCAMRRFDQDGYHGVMHPPASPSREDLISSTPFFHATIVTYKSVFNTLGGYSIEKRSERVEDIDLWFRFYANHFIGYNIDEPLYDVREDLSAVKRRTLKGRMHSIQTRANGYRLLGFPSRWLVLPAIKLMVKGLIPPHIARYVRKRIISRKEEV